MIEVDFQKNNAIILIMRTRMYFSVVLLVIFMVFNYSWTLVKAPVIGAANAQQLTDKLDGYVVSKAVSQNVVDQVIFCGFFVGLAFIWIGAVFPQEEKKTNKNEKNTIDS